jgi:hypothetical protein
MADYDNTNRGAIWKNDNKEKEKQPDFTGVLNVDGVDFNVSAWKRKPGASESAPALSFAIQPKGNAKPQQSSTDKPEEDIPF